MVLNVVESHIDGHWRGVRQKHNTYIRRRINRPMAKDEPWTYLIWIDGQPSLDVAHHNWLPWRGYKFIPMTILCWHYILWISIKFRQQKLWFYRARCGWRRSIYGVQISGQWQIVMKRRKCRQSTRPRYFVSLFFRNQLSNGQMGWLAGESQWLKLSRCFGQNINILFAGNGISEFSTHEQHDAFPAQHIRFFYFSHNILLLWHLVLMISKYFSKVFNSKWLGFVLVRSMNQIVWWAGVVNVCGSVCVCAGLAVNVLVLSRIKCVHRNARNILVNFQSVISLFEIGKSGLAMCLAQQQRNRCQLSTFLPISYSICVAVGSSVGAHHAQTVDRSGCCAHSGFVQSTGHASPPLVQVIDRKKKAKWYF